MSLQEKTIKELEALPDSEIDYSDIPATNKEFWKASKVKMPQQKKSVPLRIDSEVLEWFRSQGKGYRSKINAVLKAYMEKQKEKAKAA